MNFFRRHRKPSASPPPSPTDTLVNDGPSAMHLFLDKPLDLGQPTALEELQAININEIDDFYHDGGGISSGEIRLIRLTDRRQFVAKTVPLNDELPQYTTISYHWGSTMKTDNCMGSYVNGLSNRLPIAITDNLSYVLDVIWGLQGCCEDPDAWFWIDALCINQEDNTEKSSQVTLMKDIYRRSKQVWICLGQPDEASDMAMPFINRMANAWAVSNREKIGPYGTWTKSQKKKLGFPDNAYYLGLQVRSYFRLLHREWFRRVWTIQEYCLPGQARVICGQHSISIEDLYNASMYCFTAGLSTNFSTDWADPRAVVDLHMTRCELGEELVPDLRTLLARYRRAKASNPRDKIYALVGLCCDWKLDSSDVHARHDDPVWSITPDYGESVGNVFLNFVLDYIRRYNDLSILHFISDSRANNLELNKKDMMHYFSSQAFDASGHLQSENAETTIGLYAPTWVPDLGHSDTTNTLQGYHYGYRSTELYPQARHPHEVKKVHLDIFNACGPHQTYTPISNQYNSAMVLSVEGRRIDAIGDIGVLHYDADVVPNNWRKENPYATPYLYVKDLERIRNDADLFDISGTTRYFTGESRYETLFHCYTAGHTRALDEQGRADARAEFDEFIKDYKRMSKYAATFADPELPKNLVRIYDYHVKTCGGSRNAFIQKAAGVLRNRRVFRTPGNSKARFYGFCGLGPEHMQPGDVVYVLKGCSVPMVLRQHYGQQWTVVGECYVHGIMHGEAVSEQTQFEVLDLI